MAKKGSYDYILGYDTSRFEADSKKINSEIYKTNKELKSLQQSLDIEYDTETFEKAQRKAREAVELTEKRVEKLKATIAEMEEAGVTDETVDEYEKLQRQLTYCETEAKKAKKSLQDIDNITLERNRAELEATKKKAEELAAAYTKAGQQLTSVGSKLSLLSAGIVAGGTAAYSASADKAEFVSKAEVVFGDYISDIENLTEISLKNYGIAKSTVYEWTSLFGDMATSMGYTQAQAAEMSTDLTERLADLISFKNISADTAQIIGKALYSGESEPLKNIGVVMNEATLKAYTLAQGYEKVYTEMDQLEKLSVRYAYFMDSTSNASGDFARTAESASNSVKVLQESLKELAEEFGETLAPMITPVVNKLTQINQKLSELDYSSKANIVRIGTFIATLGPLLLIGGKIVTLIGSLKTAQAAQIIVQKAANVETEKEIALKTTAAAVTGNWILVITAGIAVLGALGTTAALTGSLIDSYAEKIKDSEKAHNDNIKAVETEEKVNLKLADELGRLAEKENKSAEEKAELKTIVDQLNKSVSGLNLTYNENTNELSKSTAEITENIKARRASLELTAYEERAVEIKKQLIEGEVELKRLETEMLNDLKPSSVSTAAYRNLKQKLDDLKAEYETVFNKIVNLTPENSQTPSQTETPEKTDDSETAVVKYNSRRKELKRLYETDKITEEKYYRDLYDAANKYLDKTSDTYQDLLVEIYKYKKKVRNAVTEEAEIEATEDYSDTLKTALSDFKSYTDEKLKTARAAADAQIKLIDDEIAARERLREQDNLDKKLSQAKAKLQYEADEENRAELQKEIARLEADKAEADYQAQVQAKKAAINAAYSEAEANAQALVDKFARMTGQSGYNYNPTTNNYSTSNSATIVNQFTGTTPGEVEAIVRKELKAAGVTT